MVRGILGRIGQTLIVMWLVATVTFFIFRVVPGDPTAITLGVEATAEAREALRLQLGLDQPLPVQYLTWLTGLLRGDLGIAYSYGDTPVVQLLAGPLQRTLELAVAGTVLAVLISIPIAVTAAVRAGTAFDQAARVGAVIGFSLPSFWLGVLLLILFSQVLGWLPAGGYVPFGQSPLGYLRSLVLPAVTVSFILTGTFVRFLRSSVIEQLQQDYIRTVRAKGVRERVVWYGHAVRNALLPFVTVVGMQFGLLVGGLVVIEQVFNWPGLGQLLVQGILTRSFDLVQAGVLITALACVLINLGVDLSYRFLDPRIRRA